METNVIYNEDCLGENGLSRLPDDSIDMILADLPYGTTSCPWDVVIPFKPLWDQYARVIKDNGAIVLTASGKFTPKLKMSKFDWFKYEWIWVKNYSGGFVNADKMPMRYHENVLVFYKEQPTYNPQYEDYAQSVKDNFEDGDKVAKGNNTNRTHGGIEKQQGVVELNRGKYPSTVKKFKAVANPSKDKVHPSQKPVELFKYFIKTYTNPGEVVLDNAIGSGTTAVACKELDRKYIGFEKDPEYAEIARERAREVQKELI